MDFARILTNVSRRWPLLWRAGIRPIDCGQSIILKSWFKEYEVCDYNNIEMKMLESGYANDMDRYKARLRRVVEKALARQRRKHTDLPHAQSCFNTIYSYDFTYLYDKVLGYIPSYRRFKCKIEMAIVKIMSFSSEQIKDIEQKIKCALSSQTDVPIDEIEVCIHSIWPYCEKHICINFDGSSVRWKHMSLKTIIAADYDMLQDHIWESSMIYINKSPREVIRLLAGMEISKLRAENAALYQKIEELELSPTPGPRYLAAVDNFNALKNAE